MALLLWVGLHLLGHSTRDPPKRPIQVHAAPENTRKSSETTHDKEDVLMMKVSHGPYSRSKGGSDVHDFARIAFI